MKKKILFIINPISGGKSKKKMPSIIDQHLDKEKYDVRISYTERVEHAYLLSKAAVKENYDIVVAVGGDGTVNEVAKGLLNSNIIMGIVPFGSGNGLARTLKIPLNPVKAVKVFNNYNSIKIDSASLNNHFFFNMAGTGFDATISHQFANLKSRGFSGYVKTTFKELSSYKPETYTIQYDGNTIVEKAFIVSVANSSQYGNEAHIAPHADVCDGLLDLVVVKPFPWYLFPSLAVKMFTKTAHTSNYVKIYKAKNIVIERALESPIHIDGEPHMESAKLNIQIIPLSMNIIVP